MCDRSLLTYEGPASDGRDNRMDRRRTGSPATSLCSELSGRTARSSRTVINQMDQINNALMSEAEREIITSSMS